MEKTAENRKAMYERGLANEQKLKNGEVVVPEEFKAAYEEFKKSMEEDKKTVKHTAFTPQKQVGIYIQNLHSGMRTAD